MAEKANGVERLADISAVNLSQKKEVGEFIRSSYADGGRFKFPERWEWLFADNPFREEEDSLAIQVASVDGKLVAQFCAMAVKMQINEEVRVGYWGLDFMVGGSYRGGGLGKFLLESLSKRCDPLLALWSSVATQRLYTLLGARVVCSVVQYEKFSRWYRFKVPPALPPPYRLNGIEIEAITKFGSEFDSLWEELSGLHGSLVVRDSKYLNWKFCAVPFARYFVFVAKRNGCVRGYVVLRLGVRPELNVGMIADVFAAPDETDVLRGLYVFATGFLEYQRVDSLVAGSSHVAHQEVLQELGYFPTRRLPVHMLTTRGSASPSEGSNRGWLIGRGDSDWDQYPAGLCSGALSAGLVASTD